MDLTKVTCPYINIYLYLHIPLNVLVNGILILNQLHTDTYKYHKDINIYDADVLVESEE